MSTPDDVEKAHTLRTAVARYDELREHDALAGAEPGDPAPLDLAATLELLALGEVIARKAAYGRQLAVRSARAAGASWTQIGAALGTSKQAAWEAHNRWIDEQAADPERGPGHLGLTDSELAAERRLAGAPESADA